MKKNLLDYTVAETLAVNKYNILYKAYKEDKPNEFFAIKVVAKGKDNTLHIKREIEILKEVKNEHVIKLIDYKITENEYYLIFEYCNGGTLANYKRQQGGKFAPYFARKILIQLIDGLDSLYNKSIMYRNLSLKDIFITYPTGDSDGELCIKLGNFSLARFISMRDKDLETSTSSAMQEMSIVGNPRYMAPELFNGDPYSFYSDIWSLGVVFYELLCENHCFQGKTDKDLAMELSRGLYKIPKELRLSQECIDFLHNCLQTEPEARLKWKEIKSHPYIVREDHEAFDINKFKMLNPIVVGMTIEYEDSYVFNCNIKYSFHSKAKATIDEDAKELMEDSCMVSEQVDAISNIIV